MENYADIWIPESDSSNDEVPHLISFDLNHQIPYIIDVLDPMKHGEGMKDAHVTYLVQSQCNLEKFSVRRRFSDFAWLHERLESNSGAIVCPLPEKHRLEYFTGDRFSSEFLERRRQALQRFLRRIVRHPVLQTMQDLKMFLELQQLVKEPIIYEKTTFSMFKNIKQNDERFVAIKSVIDTLDDNLVRLEQTYSRITKKKLQLEQHMLDFASGIASLGILDPQIQDETNLISSNVFSASEAMRESTKFEETEIDTNLREYISYCNVVKNALRQRDEKHKDYEDMCLKLDNCRLERAQTLDPKSQRSVGMFLRGKFDELTGVDVNKHKSEKLDKLQEKINSLELELNKAESKLSQMTTNLLSEVDYFHASRSIDLKQMLCEYADVQCAFFEKISNFWSNILE